MENLNSWQTIVVCIGGIISLAAVINTVGGAVEKVVKAWKASREPDAIQDSRIAQLETVTEELRREADAIKKRLDNRDDSMRIMYEAQLALLSHGIDGNNIEEMKSAKRKIENYLINK